MLSRLLHDYSTQLFGDDSAPTAHDDWFHRAANPWNDYNFTHGAKRLSAASFIDAIKPGSQMKLHRMQATSFDPSVAVNTREEILRKCCGFEWGNADDAFKRGKIKADKDPPACAKADEHFQYSEGWIPVATQGENMGFCDMYKKNREDQVLAKKMVEFTSAIVDAKKSKSADSLEKPLKNISDFVTENITAENLRKDDFKTKFIQGLEAQVANAKEGIEASKDKEQRLAIANVTSNTIQDELDRTEKLMSAERSNADPTYWNFVEAYKKAEQAAILDGYSLQHLYPDKSSKYFIRPGHPCIGTGKASGTMCYTQDQPGGGTTFRAAVRGGASKASRKDWYVSCDTNNTSLCASNVMLGETKGGKGEEPADEIAKWKQGPKEVQDPPESANAGRNVGLNTAIPEGKIKETLEKIRSKDEASVLIPGSNHPAEKASDEPVVGSHEEPVVVDSHEKKEVEPVTVEDDRDGLAKEHEVPAEPDEFKAAKEHLAGKDEDFLKKKAAFFGAKCPQNQKDDCVASIVRRIQEMTTGDRKPSLKDLLTEKDALDKCPGTCDNNEAVKAVATDDTIITKDETPAPEPVREDTNGSSRVRTDASEDNNPR